ncbi:hypothetical protein BGZ70_005859 [Mortierella alpina]|uniref:Uncharacterized protein n=1 Tax=Mortierella alpina TaxID=64518 RepID=A0A9P6M467_MORAP|nr:hypothetical protein BGZ70_005859 [Mortierella alpina]
MFVPWSFFQMYLFFFFLQILLSSALGGALALYSRSSQGYAHSIRWIRQGGYVEMFRALGTSRRKSPETAIKTLSMVVFLSVLISIADTGAKVFVKQAIRQTNDAIQIIETTPFIKADTVAKIEGWTTTVGPGKSIVDALTMAINYTRNIPDARPGQKYIPLQYPYESACDRLNFFAVRPRHTHLQISSNGCANLSITGDDLSGANVSRSYVTRRSEDRGTVVLPGRYEVEGIGGNILTGAMSADMISYVRIYAPDGRGCYTADMHRNQVAPTQSGPTHPPTTLVTKCLYATGEIITLSSTSVRFSVPRLKSFQKVTALIFDQKDDLLVGMEQSISEGLFSRLAANVFDGIQVMEVKVVGTEVRALTCAARRASKNGTTYLRCSYTITAAVLTKPQAMLPEISVRRAGNPYAPHARYSVDISIEHLPYANSSSLSHPRYAMSSFMNASRDAATYFASLGQNFNIDWKDRKIIFIFETADQQKGYEIPLWLFTTVIALMAGSLALVLLVEVSIDTKFKRSLHWMVSKELEPTLGRKAPTLMKF